MHRYLCARTYIRTAYTFTYVHKSTWAKFLRALHGMYVCMYIYMVTCVHIYVYTYVRTGYVSPCGQSSLCFLKNMCIHTYIYDSTNMHTHIQTQLHSYTYTHMSTRMCNILYVCIWPVIHRSVSSATYTHV